MKIAVVILNYNTRDYLKQFLPGLIASCEGLDAEVIVADNASSDGSVRMMKEEFPEVPLIELDQNYGFTGGYNRALAQTEADCFVLINSDIEVPKGWLKPLVEWMNSHPECGACGPNSFPTTSGTVLNTPELRAASWTATATLSAADASSRKWRKTTDNTILRPMSSGAPVPA